MAQRITIDIDGDVSKLQSAVAQANTALGTIGSSGVTGAKLKSTGKALTAGVTLPLVGIATAGVKTAADFEVSMASLGVNAGIAGKDLDRLGSLAIQLGKDTIFSANEAAMAMLELSKAGLKPAAIEGGALANTLNLAATEGIGLVEASTIMANTMNSFGLEANKTGKIVDILAAGAVASTAGVEDLAGGLKYVGATAATLKIPLDDTVTALAALNNAGIDATTAGTSLNRFMLGLTGNSDKARKAMADLGLSFEDANGQLLPMEQIIPQLSKQLEGMGEVQRIATLKTIFGVEGMRAANVLLKLNSDGYQKLNEEVNKNGVASELANARMSGMSGALEALKGSADTAALKIGKALEPAIVIVSKALTIGLNLFTALPGPIQTVIAVIGGLVAIMGPIIFLMGALKTSTALAEGALMAKKVALGLVTAAQWLWNAALSANPIGLVIIAIVAIIAIIVLLVKNWDTVTEVVGKVWDAIKDFAGKAWDSIKNFVGNIIESFTGLKNKAGEIWNNIKDKIADFVGNIIEKIKEIPGQMFNIGKNIVEGLWNGIQNMASWLKSKFTSFFKTLIPDWAEKALGIASPSKVFASIGNNIVKGLASTFNIGTVAKEVSKASPVIPKITSSNTVAKSSMPFGGNPINITINAGLGTNGAALGRQVSSAIKQYGKVSTRAAF